MRACFFVLEISGVEIIARIFEMHDASLVFEA